MRKCFPACFRNVGCVRDSSFVERGAWKNEGRRAKGIIRVGANCIRPNEAWSDHDKNISFPGNKSVQALPGFQRFEGREVF